MSSYPTLRWGILGTGWIASSFATDLKRLPDHTVVAVGSRTPEAGAAFAQKHGVPRVHSSYQALAADPEVDVVYVTTPHPWHCENTLMALRAGKPVLVEKPFAMDAAEAQAMVDLARQKNLLLVEAMWTRFLPHMAEVRKILASGILGDLVAVTADHGQWFAANPHHRLFDPVLGGGALLDLGIYPLSFAQMVLGTPSKVTAVSNPAFTGVDAQTSVILQYPSGAHAVLHTTLSAATPNKAVIVGTEARLEIDRVFYCPSSFTVTSRDGKVLQRFENAYQGHGLREEAVEVARCLREGLKETPLLPLDETLTIVKTMDEVRKQIGLAYPN